MPSAPPRRQVIESYGDGRFRISGTVHEGSVLVFPDRTLDWAVGSLAGLGADELFDRLAPLVGACGDPGAAGPTILLVGCGPRAVPIPPQVSARLRAAGLVVEAMDTGAACRTYNVLVTEDRLVVAALVAV